MVQDRQRQGFFSRYARGMSRSGPARDNDYKPSPQAPARQPGPQQGAPQPSAQAYHPQRAAPAPDRRSAAPLPEGARSRREIVAQKLSGFERAKIDWAQIHEYTLATLQETFAERRVPAEALSQPRLDITVPAIEAMRYSSLKRELVLLIASTMDSSRADSAHPAFVEILKQLTPDEAGLLALLPPAGQVIPMANLLHLDRHGHIRASLRRIIPSAYARHCARPDALPGYIDNLMRLNLVASPERLRIDDPGFYRNLLTQDHVNAHVASIPGALKPSVERTVLTITDFGDQFRHCCLDLAPAGQAPGLR